MVSLVFHRLFFLGLFAESSLDRLFKHVSLGTFGADRDRCRPCDGQSGNGREFLATAIVYDEDRLYDCL